MSLILLYNCSGPESLARSLSLSGNVDRFNSYDAEGGAPLVRPDVAAYRHVLKHLRVDAPQFAGRKCLGDIPFVVLLLSGSMMMYP